MLYNSLNIFYIIHFLTKKGDFKMSKRKVKKNVTTPIHASSFNDWEETYNFIKGYAIGKGMNNTLIALGIAKHYHKGAFRKGGEPYIIHPLEVTSYLINLNIDDDITCAAALLHDVIEDCDLPYNGKEFIDQYKLPKEVLDIVHLLTKKKGIPEKIYYDKIMKDKRALIIKLADRTNNCSTMVDAFTKDKLISYVEETIEVIYPLCAYAKEYYPEFSNAVTIIKYHIVSICETIASLFNTKPNPNKYKKTLLFIRGFATAKKMNNTLIALALAERFHEGQLRKSGDPFIIHPLRVCSYLISLNIKDDITCAASLLHEVLKKCNLPNGGTELIETYKLDPEVLELIRLVSRDEAISKEIYYENLRKNPQALLIKLSNRANTCTILTSYEPNELAEYLDEGNNFIEPLCTYGKLYYPEYLSQIINMKYHISSMCQIVECYSNEESTKKGLYNLGWGV